LGNFSVPDHSDLNDRITLLRPTNRWNQAAKQEEKLQRAARGTARTLAQLDWRAYAPTIYGKNMNTLTAKNQPNYAQNAIICDGSERPNSVDLFNNRSAPDE
jgi:hypothetical protein